MAATLEAGISLAQASIFVFALSGCVASLETLTPDRWIETYDYEAEFSGYLSEQYDLAVRRGRVPYLYIYGDWCWPCRILRHRAKTEQRFDDIFSETQVVLVDYDKLRNVKGAPQYHGVPVIIPIERDGSLGNYALSGIPWTKLPPTDIEHRLCVFFDLRRFKGSTLDRNCDQYTR